MQEFIVGMYANRVGGGNEHAEAEDDLPGHLVYLFVSHCVSLVTFIISKMVVPKVLRNEQDECS